MDNSYKDTLKQQGVPDFFIELISNSTQTLILKLKNDTILVKYISGEKVFYNWKAKSNC